MESLLNQICQSCGMPLKQDSDFGTTEDNNKSEEYCFYCFQNGKFLDEGITVEDKIEKNVKLAIKMGWSEEKARNMAQDLFPKLKRWQKS